MQARGPTVAGSLTHGCRLYLPTVAGALRDERKALELQLSAAHEKARYLVITPSYLVITPKALELQLSAAHEKVTKAL